MFTCLRRIFSVAVAVLLSAVALAQPAPSVFDTLKKTWEGKTALRAEIKFTRYQPDESGNRAVGGTDTLSILRSWPRVKYTWQTAPGHVEVRGFNGERAWELNSYRGRSRGLVAKPGKELAVHHIGDVADPYGVLFLVYEHLLWDLTFGPPVKGEPNVLSSAVLTERTRYLFYKPLPFAERMRAVIPTDATPAKLQSYDVIIYEYELPKYAIRLVPGARDAIDEIAVIQGADDVRAVLKVLKRDESTRLPLEWSYDEYRDGKWTQGYVATVTSFDMNPAFSSTDFDPRFPPGTQIRDELLSDVGIDAGALREAPPSLTESITEEAAPPAEAAVDSTASAVSPSTAAGPAAPAPAPLPAAAPGWRDRLLLVATLVAPIAFIVLIAYFLILRRRR